MGIGFGGCLFFFSPHLELFCLKKSKNQLYLSKFNHFFLCYQDHICLAEDKNKTRHEAFLISTCRDNTSTFPGLLFSTFLCVCVTKMFNFTGLPRPSRLLSPSCTRGSTEVSNTSACVLCHMDSLVLFLPPCFQMSVDCRGAFSLKSLSACFRKVRAWEGNSRKVQDSSVW